MQPEPRESEWVRAVGLERGRVRSRRACAGQGQAFGFPSKCHGELCVPSQGEAVPDDQHGKISWDGCGERWAWGEN